MVAQSAERPFANNQAPQARQGHERNKSDLPIKSDKNKGFEEIEVNDDTHSQLDMISQYSHTHQRAPATSAAIVEWKQKLNKLKASTRLSEFTKRSKSVKEIVEDQDIQSTSNLKLHN